MIEVDGVLDYKYPEPGPLLAVSFKEEHWGDEDSYICDACCREKKKSICDF